MYGDDAEEASESRFAGELDARAAAAAIECRNSAMNADAAARVNGRAYLLPVR